MLKKITYLSSYHLNYKDDQRCVEENNIFVIIPYKLQRYVEENNIFAVIPYYKDVCCDLLRLSIIISNLIIFLIRITNSKYYLCQR